MRMCTWHKNFVHIAKEICSQTFYSVKMYHHRILELVLELILELAL